MLNLTKRIVIIGSAWIDDPGARNLLFELLRRTERENGWPWAYFEQRILHTWQGGSRSR